MLIGKKGSTIRPLEKQIFELFPNIKLEFIDSR